MIKGNSSKHNTLFGVGGISVIGENSVEANRKLTEVISATIDTFVDIFNNNNKKKNVKVVSVLIMRNWTFYVELNTGDVIQIANLMYQGNKFGDFDISNNERVLASKVLAGCTSNIMISGKGNISNYIMSNGDDTNKIVIKPSIDRINVTSFRDGTIYSIPAIGYNSLIFDFSRTWYSGNVSCRIKDWVLDPNLFPQNLYNMDEYLNQRGKRIYSVNKVDKLRHNCCFNIINPISLLLAYDSIKLQSKVNINDLDSQLLSTESDNDRFVNKGPVIYNIYGHEGDKHDSYQISIPIKPGVNITKTIKMLSINNKKWPVCLVHPTVHNIANYIPINLVQSYYNYVALLVSYYVNFDCLNRHYPNIGFYDKYNTSGVLESYNWLVRQLDQYNYVEEFKSMYPDPFNAVIRFCKNIQFQLTELLAIALIDNEIDNYFTWDVVMLSDKIFRLFNRLYAFNEFIKQHNIPENDAAIYWVYYIVNSMNNLMDFPVYEGDIPEYNGAADNDAFFFVTYCRIILLDMLLSDYRRLDGI